MPTIERNDALPLLGHEADIGQKNAARSILVGMKK